ncbi:RDD family protein [Streptomyces sp. NPDC046727]|uniref:RDD family protein n=1 Tax=Streptomyces sp. NPDC046727 TaxID=3155373 RepID=UPI0033F5327E
MTSEPPPGSGEQPPEDDPFRKRPPSDQGSGSPYDTPPGGGRQPPPYGGGPYGGSPYGGYPADPLAGMPPLADSGMRTLARLVDIVLLAVVDVVLTLLLGLPVNSETAQSALGIVWLLLIMVIPIAYDTFTTAKWGQTLGKKWLRLRVANLNDGSTPATQTALIRALVLWLPCYCCSCLWLVLAGGWSFFDKPYKQGLHDKAAKTVVVSTG